MNFAVAVILIVFGASSAEMSVPVASTNILKNLDRVKRCSSGQLVVPCALTTTDESYVKTIVADKKPEVVNRPKRSFCFCTIKGCDCTLIDRTENKNHLRSKRNAYDEVFSSQPQELTRKKRQSCACGRHGCFCDDLDDLGDKFIQVSNSYSSSASSSSSTSSSSSFTYYG